MALPSGPPSSPCPHLLQTQSEAKQNELEEDGATGKDGDVCVSVGCVCTSTCVNECVCGHECEHVGVSVSVVWLQQAWPINPTLQAPPGTGIPKRVSLGPLREEPRHVGPFLWVKKLCWQICFLLGVMCHEAHLIKGMVGPARNCTGEVGRCQYLERGFPGKPQRALTHLLPSGQRSLSVPRKSRQNC